MTWNFEERIAEGFWDTSRSAVAELVGSGGQTVSGELSLKEYSFLRIERKNQENAANLSAVSFWVKNEGIDYHLLQERKDRTIVALVAL